jgi:hypothetical protein
MVLQNLLHGLVYVEVDEAMNHNTIE